MTDITIVDAQETLPDLVGRVRRGEEIVITERGEAVARLVPPGCKPAGGADEIVERARRLRESIAARGERFTWDELKAWRDEGRP